MATNAGDILCGRCKENLPNEGELAHCRLCNANFHLGECSIKVQSWRGLGKSGQEKWVCFSCRRKEKPKSQTDEDTTETWSQKLSNKIDSLMEMKEAVSKIEKSMEFHSSKYDEILSELKNLREENKELKKDLITMKKKLDKSEESVKCLTERVNGLEQYGRRVNLEIQGVPVQGENTREENITSVVEGLAKNIGVTFSPNLIHKMHRLQPNNYGRPPVIIVQFMTSTTRDEWLKAGKRAKLSDRNTGSKIFFNENLTQYYRGLLKEAKLRAGMYEYKFVWFQSGKILVKKSPEDKNIISIKCYDDLPKIGKEKTKPKL